MFSNHDNNNLMGDDPINHLHVATLQMLVPTPTPWEEVSLANAWDISQTQLSRPTIEKWDMFYSDENTN